ncbi:VWA domain-containing protein [candidate division KSB1 bacterium]|nr:VWA domain-containing protein [candidate division KSB1 bacterium]
MKSRALCIFVLISLTSAKADGVMKVLNLPYTYLQLTAVEIHADINNQVAQTTSRQTFINNLHQDVELKYGFPLPLTASVTRLRWTKHGLSYQAELVGKPQDTTAVNPGGEIDRQFVDYIGQNPFYFSFRDSLAHDSTIVVEVTYIQLLKYDSGQVIYRYPLAMKSLLMTPLDFFKATLELQSERELITLSSSTHAAQVNLNSFSGKLTLDLENYLPAHNFVAEYQMAQDSMGIFLLSSKSIDGAGYFMLLAEPNQSGVDSSQVRRNLVFILDRSGSMSGSKLQLAKSNIAFCLDNLRPYDMFNILAFNEQIEPLQYSAVFASEAAIIQAKLFMDELAATGGTAITNAIETGLAQVFPESMMNAIVFVSDGQGKLDQNKIRSKNIDRIPVFVVGVGDDAYRYLLTPLAENNFGFAAFSDELWDDSQNQAFFKKITHRVLSEIQLSFDGVYVDSLYPQMLPDIYIGEQLIVLGRYAFPGHATINLLGNTAHEPLSYTFDSQFSDNSPENHFISKMWAKKLIEDLIGQLAASEEGSAEYKALMRKIIDVSIQYGIMTPFTSYQDSGIPTSIKHGQASSSSKLNDLELNPNYPNPFNSITTISFVIRRSGDPQTAEIAIYNIIGERIHTIRMDIPVAGRYAITWDGCDGSGKELASGTYFYVLRIGNLILHRKLVLLR